MIIDGRTRMAAVVANPIKHSLSPFIHNRAFELVKENGIYVAWEVGEKDLAQTLANIRLFNMYGVNLSMPHKQLAMWYVNELSDEAKLIGAINTVVNTDGKLVGHNTDGIGFVKSLEAKNYYVRGKEITILGGGGAAIAIIVTAALKKVAQINVFARHSESYKPLKTKLETLSALTGVKIALQELNNKIFLQEAIARSSLLTNATSVGMDGVSNPMPEELKLPPNQFVVDVIYKGLGTPFLKWASIQGATTMNGIGMLLYQAAESFHLWTGKEMPISQIEEEIKEKF